jgi:hypothetical protein
MVEERARAPRIDQGTFPSTQPSPDTQTPQANTSRTDHTNTTSPLQASFDAGKSEKANAPQATLTPTLLAQRPSIATGGIWEFTWNEIVNGIIQVIAVIVALVFGAWAIKSYDSAQQANALARNGLQQTLIANQLALLAVCASYQVGARLLLITCTGLIKERY